MAQERKGLVAFKGNGVTLVGNEVKPGDNAPNFTVLNNAMQPVTLDSAKGKTRILCSIPSLDTPVCATEMKRFNQEASSLGDDVVVYAISMDLPFAQKRFCEIEGAKNVEALSDFKDRDFGQKYGVYIKELGLLARAIFVVGPDDKVKYVQIVPEIAQEPNYDEALQAAK